MHILLPYSHHRSQTTIVIQLKTGKMSPPRYSDIGALSCDVYKAIVVITKRATIDPYMPRIWLDLNAINIMTPTTLKLKIAHDDVLTFLQPQTFPRQFHPLPSPIYCLIRRHAQVRRQMNRTRNFKNNPQRFHSTTSFAKGSRTII